MLRKLLVFGILMMFPACATSDMKKFKVDSVPPGAQVDVNGIVVGVTPSQIELECIKRWVGVLNAPGGWTYDQLIYEVTVYPSKQNHGVSQTKRINPCMWKGSEPAELMFDLGLREIKPAQQIELDIHDSSSK